MPGASPCPTGCCAWTPEPIGTGIHGHVALRLGTTGTPHVAFMNASTSTYSSSYSVVHATRGTGWTVETPDYVTSSSSENPKYSLSGVSMALDAAGVPYVGYQRAQSWQTGSRNLALRVARKSGSSWTIDAVDTVQNTYSSGLQPPITLQADDAGKIHATFLKCCFNNYYSWGRYAVRDGGAWTVEDLPSMSSVSLGVTSSGTPHVLLTDHTLQHATKSGATWDTNAVASDNLGSVYTDLRNEAITVDPQGTPHVCYQSDGGAGPLVYARRSSGQWVTEVADSTAGAGESCAIALDSQGQPLICHRATTTAGLRCAKRAGGVWRASAIAAAGQIGLGIDVAFDAQDKPHVVYFDDAQKKWMYLR